MVAAEGNDSNTCADYMCVVAQSQCLPERNSVIPVSRQLVASLAKYSKSTPPVYKSSDLFLRRKDIM